MQHLIKITAGFLLLVQVLADNSTESSGGMIDISWLRELGEARTISPNTAVAEEEMEYDQGSNASEASNDYSSGIASGSMAIFNEEEQNVAGQDKSESETSDDLNAVNTTQTPVSPKGTAKDPELPDTISTDRTNSSQNNMREAEAEINSTKTPQNVQPPDSPTLQLTTLAPKANTAPESETKPEQDQESTNGTGSANTTTVKSTAAPKINKTSTESKITEKSPVTIAAPSTPEEANKTNTGGGSGSSSERGVASDPNNRGRRQGAWGAVLGTAVAVACVALVAYFILKKKQQKDFSHRKLVEEFPSDPVHRLETNEPLDLNFGRLAYYNPGLQGDQIQMTNIPGHR